MIGFYTMAPLPSRNSGFSPYIGRLAPAPTGALHLGNARTFLLAWLRARLAGGKILLRLEDLDHPKVKAGAAAQAYDDLRWLGLDWDDGPAESLPERKAGAAFPDPFIQSHNLALYRSALEKLAALHLIYPCVCTRKDLETVLAAPNSGEELREKRYPGACRDRFPTYAAAKSAAAGEPGWRFRVEPGASSFVDGFAGSQQSELAVWSGDFLLARGDKAGYQLAVVVDDQRMGVTEIVRGDDLLPSTHRQLALYAALGFAPPAFFHIPLVVGHDGRRLAKRHGDSRISLLRQKGIPTERVLGWLAASCGWTSGRWEEMALAEIMRIADFAAMPKSPVVVTDRDLAWLGFTA